VVPTFAIANFLSALGGGALLSQLMGLLKDVPMLKGDSLLAYLLGTTVGLIVMKSVKQNQLLNYFTKFSLASAIASIFLAILLKTNFYLVTTNTYFAFFFFGVLVIRFTFWFLARIIRMDIVAGDVKQLAWTEFAYSAGIILGLLIWPSWLNVFQILMIDIAAQTLAAVLDIIFVKTSENSATASEEAANQKMPKHIFIMFAGFIVCITIATQIVEFGFAALSPDLFNNGKKFGTYIVAVGYIGAAVGAWILAKLTPMYHTEKLYLGVGIVSISKYQIPLIFLCAISFLFLMTAFWVPFANVQSAQFISLSLLLLATLFYELVVLVLLNKLGEIAKKHNDVGSVGSIYAYMGAIGSLCMLVFVQTLSTHVGFIITSLLFFIAAYLFLLTKRL